MTDIAAAEPQEGMGDRTRLARAGIALCCLTALGAALASLALGPVPISLAKVLSVLVDAVSGGGEMDRDSVIVRDIRLPRTVLGLMVGASLAVSGAMMQGLFRNPLADPGIVGVSSGAALAAVAAIVLGAALAPALPSFLAAALLPLAAFAGGLATTIALYLIATREGRTSVATMLLAGIALGALAGAATGFLVFLSDDQQLRQFTFWSLGSLGGATWAKVAAAAPFILIVLAAAPFVARGLNALALGEADAFHLGIEVQHIKRAAVFLVAAAVGAAVAVSGVIGFIGLVVPHILRLTIGPDHRFLLPASACLGAGLLLGADIAARILVAPAELPIGIITAAFGAPFFLWLLLRRQSGYLL